MTFVRTTIISAGIFTAALAISPASADIFKHVDENGNVSYSDQPALGSERIETRNHRSSSRASGDEEPDGGAEGEGKAESPDYKSLQILTPREGKVVDSETGAVQVIMLPTPSLGKSDSLVIEVDGRQVSKGRDVNLSIQNVPKGKHSVSSRIENSEGEVIIESASINFTIGQ